MSTPPHKLLPSFLWIFCANVSIGLVLAMLLFVGQADRLAEVISGFLLVFLLGINLYAILLSAVAVMIERSENRPRPPGADGAPGLGQEDKRPPGAEGNGPWPRVGAG